MKIKCGPKFRKNLMFAFIKCITLKSPMNYCLLDMLILDIVDKIQNIKYQSSLSVEARP